MTEEYKVTSSSHWRWLPGMVDTKKNICVVYDDDDDGSDYAILLASKEKISTNWCYVSQIEPDLSHPATQGAIIFGIFLPLGIYMYRNGMERGTPWWQVDPHWHGAPEDAQLRKKLSSIAGTSIPELITSVFKALDKRQ